MKSLPDDPIVYPSLPGMSHLHDFHGSRDTNAYSTPQSLVTSSGTSCKPTVDKSGYWWPALMIDGEPVPPTSAALYYRGPNKGYDASLVRALPAGLNIIAGDSKATAPQPYLTTYYQCGPDASATSPKSAVPYDCSPWPGNTLRAVLTFPSCWDGVHLDSADHKSHMAYPLMWGSNYCPLTHPVMVVRLTAVVAYESVVNGDGATLSSGSPYSFHGDFMNGWDQYALNYLTQACVRIGSWCRFQNMIPVPTGTEQASASASAAAPRAVEDQVTVKGRVTHTGLRCGRAGTWTLV